MGANGYVAVACLIAVVCLIVVAFCVGFTFGVSYRKRSVVREQEA